MCQLSIMVYRNITNKHTSSTVYYVSLLLLIMLANTNCHIQ